MKLALSHWSAIVNRAKNTIFSIELLDRFKFVICLMTLSIFPRSNPSKFFNVRPRGSANLQDNNHQQTTKRSNKQIGLMWWSWCEVSSPVFDVRFSSSKPWSIYSKSNRFESSLFSSFHKLSNHISILIHLNQENKQSIQSQKFKRTSKTSETYIELEKTNPRSCGSNFLNTTSSPWR